MVVPQRTPAGVQDDGGETLCLRVIAQVHLKLGEAGQDDQCVRVLVAGDPPSQLERAIEALVEASLRSTIGETYAELGLYADALNDGSTS